MASRLAAAARRRSVSPPLPTATAFLSSSLGPSRATPTPTALSLAASSPAILGRRALSLPILGRSMLPTKTSSFSAGVFSLSPRALSTALLGRRAQSLPHAASVLCTPARRGMATGIPPEVQEALKKIEMENATRHDKLMEEIRELQKEVLRKYSASTVTASKAGLTAGKVAMRVSGAVLAFGGGSLLVVLHTINDGWKNEFFGDVRPMIQKMVNMLKAELLSELHQVVRDEVESVQKEKKAAAAAAAKK